MGNLSGIFSITSNTTSGDDLIRIFRLSFLWEGKLRTPFKIVRPTDSLGDFISRLEVIGNNFNRFLENEMIGHKVLETEGKIQIRTNSFYIRGKYDLITEDPNGKLALWDWKSGKAPSPQYFEDFLHQKIQLVHLDYVIPLFQQKLPLLNCLLMVQILRHLLEKLAQFALS